MRSVLLKMMGDSSCCLQIPSTMRYVLSTVTNERPVWTAFTALGHWTAAVFGAGANLAMAMACPNGSFRRQAGVEGSGHFRLLGTSDL
jgi:hypothetical protein